MSEARDGKLTPQRWHDFVQWLALQERFFTNEGRIPPFHIRENSVTAFSRCFGIPRHVIDAALDAWAEDAGTVH